MDVERTRRQFPAVKGMTYLDNAGAGLPPVRVTDAMKGLIEDWSKSGELWEEWLEDVVEARRLFGKLIGAEGDEVGVLPSASVALASIASSVDLKGKKVVTTELNFPTNIVLWERMRAAGLVGRVELLKAKEGRIPIEEYGRAITPDTALVAIDHVSWLSGSREPIREISRLAHRHGALVVVDAFHSLGVLPFAAKREGADVVVSGFYKWLCGPHGVACVYASKDVLERLNPPFVGWHGVQDNVVERTIAGRDPFDRQFELVNPKLAATAARFEWGTWAMVCVRGATEAMRFVIAQGVPRRYAAIRKLKLRLEEGLREIGADVLTPPSDENEGAGIVTFRPKDHAGVVSRLAKLRITVSGRFGFVRASPHCYNTEGEVDLLLRELAKMERLL